MSEFEAAIREHLELKQRRGQGPEASPPVEVNHAVGMPAASALPSQSEWPDEPLRQASNGAAHNGLVADLLGSKSGDAGPTPAGEGIRSGDEDFGLLAAGELAARRAMARARSQRIRHARRALALAGLASLVAVSVPSIARVLPAKTGRARHAAVRSVGGRERSTPRVSVPATYPFARSSSVRAPSAADELEAFWSDGVACSVGCRAPGVVAGWPLKPFHAQHALRAGLNEQRDTSFHHGIDIQAYDGSPVYAIQPGRAHIIQATGADSRVQVANFIYWHIRPDVKEGQPIASYREVVGKITAGHGHLHLSEVDAAGRYINPLRPRGRALLPWADSEPPVLDRPRLTRSGEVVVRIFDPQSFRTKTTYRTPIIAPAAVAYRIFDQHGKRLGPLHWALRGSQNLQWTAQRAAAIYATGSSPVHAGCFEHQAVCRPDYIYVLAGGLTPALTGLNLSAGRYRLAAYAWDWAGNASARDAWFTVHSDGTASG